MKTGTKLGLTVVAVLAMYITWRGFGVREARLKTEAEARASIVEAREKLEALRVAKAAQDKRIAGSTFRATRFGGLDGQCLGLGKPPHGYVIEGSTYADNVSVSSAASCEAFGSPKSENITNFFCCRLDNLPAILEVQVDDNTKAP